MSSAMAPKEIQLVIERFLSSFWRPGQRVVHEGPDEDRSEHLGDSGLGDSIIAPFDPRARRTLRLQRLSALRTPLGVNLAQPPKPSPEIILQFRTRLLHSATRPVDLIMRCVLPERARRVRTRSQPLSNQKTEVGCRGFRTFDSYRLRLVLNHGRIGDNQPASRIMTRARRLAA
jgi:hypothetical protein